MADNNQAQDNLNTDDRQRVGGGPDSLAGPASRQGGEQAHSGQYTGFQKASPDSNVFPTGSPQSDRGAAEGSIPGGSAGAEEQHGKAGLSVASAGDEPSDANAFTPGQTSSKSDSVGPTSSGGKDKA